MGFERNGAREALGDTLVVAGDTLMEVVHDGLEVGVHDGVGVGVHVAQREGCS